MTNDTHRAIHHGRNVRRFREEKMIRQDVLAVMLGEGWTPKRVAQIEETKEIEPALIEELAKALEISPDAIKNREDNAISLTQNNYDGTSNNNNGPNYYYNCSIGASIDKIMELQAEIKKLQEVIDKMGKK